MSIGVSDLPRGTDTGRRSRIHAFLERVGRWRPPLGLVLYLISILLIFGVFLPGMTEIRGWDESAIVNSGRSLVDSRELAPLASGPLTQLLYGLIYAAVRGSVFWLMESVWLGRLIQYSLMWAGMWIVGRSLARHTSPLVTTGLFLLSSFTLEMLPLPSDPLFAAMSALGLGRFLAFVDKRRVQDLAGASAFVGLAALARPDGMVLFAVFLFLAIVLGWKRLKPLPLLGAALVPFVALVGGYVLARGAITGDFGTDLAGRAYINFETGHGAIYQAPGRLNPEVEVHLEARRVYGTPEENNYSIFRAIGRNPDAYLQRLMVTLRGLPQRILRAYGIRIGAVLFLLALRGALEMARKRDFGSLVGLCLWPATLATGLLITLYRTGHLLFAFPSILALAGVGVSAVVHDLSSRRERAGWTVVLLGLSLYGLVDGKLAITYGAIVLLIGLLLAWLAWDRMPPGPMSEGIALLLLLASGLVIRGSLPSPKIPEYGTEPAEQVLLYLVQHYEPGTPIAAGAPGMVYAARLTYVGLTDEDVPVGNSPVEFLEWLKGEHVQAILVDRSLFVDNPAVWDLIQPQIRDGYERVFVSDDGDLQVLQIVNGP